MSQQTINIIRVSDDPNVCEYRISVSRSDAAPTDTAFTRIEPHEICRLLASLGMPERKVQEAITALGRHGQFLAWNVSLPEDLLDEMVLR